MERGTKLTVKSSSLEFRVSGSSYDWHYGEYHPFSGTTTDWEEALGWLQTLEEFGGNPHLTVVEVIEVEEAEAPLRMVRLDADWAELDVEGTKRKLESLVRSEEASRRALTEHPEQQAEAEKALESVRAKQQLLHGLLEEQGIVPS